jgi:hypothetical protein
MLSIKIHLEIVSLFILLLLVVNLLEIDIIKDALLDADLMQGRRGFWFTVFLTMLA